MDEAMNVGNRKCQLRVTSSGVATAVLAVILVLAVLGIGIGLFGTSVGLFAGLLAGVVCGAIILLINIRDVLEESRAMGTDSTPHGKTLVAASEGSEKQQAEIIKSFPFNGFVASK